MVKVVQYQFWLFHLYCITWIPLYNLTSNATYKLCSFSHSLSLSLIKAHELSLSLSLSFSINFARISARSAFPLYLIVRPTVLLPNDEASSLLLIRIRILRFLCKSCMSPSINCGQQWCLFFTRNEELERIYSTLPCRQMIDLLHLN